MREKYKGFIGYEVFFWNLLDSKNDITFREIFTDDTTSFEKFRVCEDSDIRWLDEDFKNWELMEKSLTIFGRKRASSFPLTKLFSSDS